MSKKKKKSFEDGNLDRNFDGGYGKAYTYIKRLNTTPESLPYC